MFKKIWFQVHWFIGVTAGAILIVMGVSGALLAFHEELLDMLNPGIRHVTPRPDALLTPAQLLARIQTAQPEARIASVWMTTDPEMSARVTFRPPRGVRRGETRYVDPYTGTLLAPLRGEVFFQFVVRLHRWFLLPNEIGKILTGSAAMSLLILSLSGLYLRWPRQLLAWRTWFKPNCTLSGYALLRNLHLVLGTWALAMYVVLCLTGMYWAFGWFKNTVDVMAGETPRQRNVAKPIIATRDTHPIPVDLSLTWSIFLREAKGYRSAQVRLPEKPGEPIQITYFDVDASHEGARNRMSVASTGEVMQHQRYTDKTAAERIIASAYPLHIGTYFGLPGRIIMLLVSLGLPLFAISGWMLYLDRRQKKAQVRTERTQFNGLTAKGASSTPAESILVAFATQSGQAERIALRTATALQVGGMPVVVQALAAFDSQRLCDYCRVLFVVSTFGEGEPPDSARRFAQQLAQCADNALTHMRYAILALGDRSYQTFCGFGHALNRCLSDRGAQTLFPLIEVNNGDVVALKQWQHALGITLAMRQESPYATWRLVERRLLNAGSQGAPMFHLEFEFTGQVAHEVIPNWLSGALVEVMPPCLQGDTAAPRYYSVASIPPRVHLLVRQVNHDVHGLGVASGWLTHEIQPGEDIKMRLLANPGFNLVTGDPPCIFIANGSGLAGLRGHLQARVHHGQRRNWLLFGERNREYDFYYQDEIKQWQDNGFLTRVDLAFSRDQIQRMYVQDCLRAAASELRTWVGDGAVIYVCGSLHGMAAGVEQALTDILGAAVVDDLITIGRYRRDVY